MMCEYEPTNIGKASGYATSIRANLSDAKTNGSESILVRSSLWAHRHQLRCSSNDAKELLTSGGILT